ncbi:MAG: tetratricopeptide repeat protein [Betaproteobacteria bacterium]|nr:tetratricopeptide repeat protein [Betaproteobacteria bacterium]
MKQGLMDRFWRWYRLEAADWLLWLRRPAMARSMFESVLRDHPQDAHALSCLAFLEAGQGNRITAVEHLQRAVSLNADDVRAHYNLAFMLQELNRHDEAVVSFERVLALKSDHDLAHYGKALSLIALDRFDEAIPALKRNTELQPMSPYGWYQLARIHHARGRKEKAEKVIRHLATFDPKVARQLVRETGIQVETASF